MKIKRTLGTGMASLGLVVGLAGMAGAAPGSIEWTGPDSHNVVKERVSHRVNVRNDNDIELKNENRQEAFSGDARVEHNTRGGEARSGDAVNRNSTNMSVTVDNSRALAGLGEFGGSHNSGGWGSIRDTGPHSHNEVSRKTTNRVDIHNNNDIEIHNTNNQTAVSGDATVWGNTHGGSAISGDAINTNSTTMNVRVTN